MASNILKILRSLTPGNRPTAHTYGEPYVNLGENQFGVMDSGNNPRDLLGVPIFSSAVSYAAGAVVSHGGQLYVSYAAVAAGAWNPLQWSPIYAQTNPGCGRLAFGSATQLVFGPYGGNLVKINGVLYPIPPSGVPINNTNCQIDGVAGQNLAASRTYYVYAYVSGGAVALEFSATTGNTTSSTLGNVGTEIKNGDDSRTVVGLIFTNASAQFQDDPNQRLMASWFNRQFKYAYAALGNNSTTSTSYVWLGGLAPGLVCWAGSAVSAFCIVQGALIPQASSNFGSLMVSADSPSSGFGTSTGFITLGSASDCTLLGGNQSLGAGYHQFGVAGSCSTTGLTLYANNCHMNVATWI